MKQQNFFDDPKGVLQDIQQQSLRLQLHEGQQDAAQEPPEYSTSHQPQQHQCLSTFTTPSVVQQATSTLPITTTSPTTMSGLFPYTSSLGRDASHSHPISVNRRPKPGILRLDMSKPRRSSGGSVEFRMQPQLVGANISTPVGTTPPPHQLSVTWATPPCDSTEREFKIKSATPSPPPGAGVGAATATDATPESGGSNIELNEITGGRKRSPEEKPYEFSLSYAASNLASPVTEPFIDFPLHRHYEDCHIQSPGYSIHTDNNNDNDDDDDEEDYSVSVSAIMQRRASVRGYRRKSSSRNSRRASSPMDHVLDNAERRRSSVYTTSSDEGTNQESTQEQIFENIRLHKEVIQSVKLQPWPIRKKLKLVRQAKTYVARHEGALQERFAMSRNTRDLWARFKILMAARWRHWKREIYSFLTVLIPWELRIKEIESHFGSGVASYFTFLRWLMWMNLMIALPLVLFVIGPEYFATKHDVTDPRKKMTSRESNVAGNLLTIWEFEGYLKYSPMFYGYYSGSNATETHPSGAYALGYVLPLAYFLTAVVVYIYSFVATLKKMAENSRNSKLSEKDDECTFSWKLFTGWDFMIGHAETAHNRIASVVLNFKEALLEEAEKKKDNRDWRIILQRVVVNILVIGLLAASGVSVVYLVNMSEKLNKRDDWLSKNAVNVCMNLLALIMPMIFEALGFFEHWHPRQQLRLQLARVMILNLLNLYSLMFTSFFKIESKGEPLYNLQLKNDTATKELKELDDNWNKFMAMTTTTTEAYSLMENDSTLAISTATEAIMTAATAVAMKLHCFNQTVRCSKPWSVTRNMPSTTTLATTTLIMLNLTTTMMTTDQPTETTWTTTTDLTTPTTAMTFNTTQTGIYTSTTIPFSNSIQDTTFPSTTTEADVSSTPMTTTTTEYPGNDTVFDYYDYFGGLALTAVETPKDEESKEEATDKNDTKARSKRKNKKDKRKGKADNDVPDYLNEVYKTTMEPKKYKGKGKISNVKPAKSGPDAASLHLLRKSKHIRRDKQDETTSDTTTSIPISTITTASSTISLTEADALLTTKKSSPDKQDEINLLPNSSILTSTSPFATSIKLYTETNASTTTEKSKNSSRDEEDDTTLPSTITNTTSSLTSATASGSTTTTESPSTTTSTSESANTTDSPSTTTSTSASPSTTDSPSTNSSTSESATTIDPPSTTTTTTSSTYSPPPIPTTTTESESEATITTTPTPALIWEPNERLQDLVDFFTTSTARPRNGYLPTQPAPLTTMKSTIGDDLYEDLATTPYYLEGDLDTSQTMSYDFNEIDGDDNYEKCYRRVCLEVPAMDVETTTMSTSITTTLSPRKEYEINRMKIEAVIDNIELELTTMCWETALGQELSKVIVLDALMAIGTSLIIDFLRALFVRYVNQNWCWDMEKTFPQYGDFKIAENILMLINNQGQVWMGIFFSPGLVIINLVKLVVMMYFRSWIVLTCNVPHEVVFKASKSNNFYLALLLTVLFLCVLPVGYAIVWLRPSWHCGPFSKYKTVSTFIIETTQWALPEHLHRPLEYLTSSSTVIPLLLLMMLIIYYLISLTGALREANQDLKTQLQKEREEERKKFFKVPEIKASDNNSGTMSNRWRKVLEASSPVTPTTTQPDFESEEYKNQARKELISRIMKKALRKDSGTSDEETLVRHGRDDDTDTEHHDSLPHDEGSNEKPPGLSKLQQIRRTRKPSLVDIVQIANSERERLRSLHHHTQNDNGSKESNPRGRFKVERPERRHEKEEHERNKNKEKERESTDSGNDPDVKTRIINERRQSLLRKKREDDEKAKEKEKEKEKEQEKEKIKNKDQEKDKDKEMEENKDTKQANEKYKEKEKEKEQIKEAPKTRDKQKGNGNEDKARKDKGKGAGEDKDKVIEVFNEDKPSSPIKKKIYDSFRRKKRDDKEKLASLKQNSFEKTNEEETKTEETSHNGNNKDTGNGNKKLSLSLRRKDKHIGMVDEAKPEKSLPKLTTKSSFKVVDEKSGSTHDDKYSPLTLEHFHNLGEKFKFKRNKHKTTTEPEVFKFDTNKTAATDADIATTPTWQHLEAELQSPRAMEDVNAPMSASHLNSGADKLVHFSRQSRRKIGSFLNLVKDAVKRPEHELEHDAASGHSTETTIDIPVTPRILMSSAFNNAFMLPLALHTTTTNTDATATTDSIQPYIMPRAPLEVPEDMEPPSYNYSMAACEIITAPPQDTEELDKAGPITFSQRGISQRRRAADKPIRQDSLSSNWSVENIPTITISATPEGDDLPKSPIVPKESEAPTPVSGPKVNVIKIRIDE